MLYDINIHKPKYKYVDIHTIIEWLCIYGKLLKHPHQEHLTSVTWTVLERYLHFCLDNELIILRYLQFPTPATVSTDNLYTAPFLHVYSSNHDAEFR